MKKIIIIGGIVCSIILILLLIVLNTLSLSSWNYFTIDSSVTISAEQEKLINEIDGVSNIDIDSSDEYSEGIHEIGIESNSGIRMKRLQIANILDIEYDQVEVGTW